ncbi:MAG TPA: ATP-binding protein [Anaerolineae bacterium]|nr:ATP-binding protein [Anaerolineae bacterium]
MSLQPLSWADTHRHIAEFISSRLADGLRSRAPGYRVALTDLAPDLMTVTAEHLRRMDLPEGVQVVIVGEGGEGDMVVSPTRLIELRNDEDNVPILLALIPTSFRSYAEDSYGEHNFAMEDPEALLLACRDHLLQDLNARGFPAAQAIVRRGRITGLEVQIRYLLSAMGEGLDLQVFGAYLPLVGLPPDLALDLANLDARLEDSKSKVTILVDPTRPIVERIDRLKLSGESVRIGLLRLFADHDPQDVEAWGLAVVEEALALKAQNRSEERLSYDNWIEGEGDGPTCELEIFPLSKYNPVDEAGQVNIKIDAKIKVRWRWDCKPPQEVRFVVRGYRDEDELFSSGSIGYKLRSKTINLRGKDVDEGHCVLQMQAIGPEGSVLDLAESEPFWIVGQDEAVAPPPARQPKWGDEVFSLAEAQYRAARKLGPQVAPQEILWQARASTSSIDTLKIRYSRAVVYHIRLSPALRNFELTVLMNPMQVGFWRYCGSDSGSEVVYQSVPIGLADLPGDLYKDFAETRRSLFDELRNQSPPGAGEGFGNVVETADLLALRDRATNYAKSYAAVLRHYSKAQDRLNLRRSLALDSLVKDDEVILSPLHPLKLIWMLQYQELVSILSADPDHQGTGRNALDQVLFPLLTSVNYPPFVPGPDGRMRINAGQLHLLWSSFSTDPTQYRRIADRLKDALGVAGGETAAEALDPRTLAHRLNRYLNLHPFIRQLRLAAINPGDGMAFLEVVRALEREWGSRGLRYDLAFFAHEEPDQAATAFDRLMVEEDESRKRREDDELVESLTSLMSPKLTYAKHPLHDYREGADTNLDHHALVFLDAFETEVGSLPTRPERSASFLGHLLNDLSSYFEASPQEVYWAHTVVPQQQPDLPSLAPLTTLMASILQEYMQGCGLLLSGNADAWPVVYLQIRKEQRDLVILAHRQSDWVVFVDRYFDIDFLDHPNSPFCEYYLVDYVPSAHAGMGHKLIVSTASTLELQRLVAQELGALGLPRDAAPDVVDTLQAMSGRLAIKQLTGRNLVREAIGLSFLWMGLRRNGRLSRSIFLPIDSHLDLFRSDGESQQRTDALLIRLDPEATALSIALIDSKLRSQLGAEEFLQLKGYISDQLERTRKDLVALLRPAQEPHDLARLMAWQDFRALLLFYLERARRHHLMNDDEATRWQAALGGPSGPHLCLQFEKEAHVFNVSFAGQHEEVISGGITLYHVGRDSIVQLLSSRLSQEADDEMEVEPAPALPEAVPRGETGDHQVEEITEPAISVEGEEAEPTQETPEPSHEGVRVYLGETVYDQRPICWEPLRTDPRRLTNPHVLIVGTSGAGKTQSTMAFLQALWEDKVPSLILDFHGEYANPDADAFRAHTHALVADALDGIPVNPLEVPLDPYRKPVNPKRVVWEVSEIIGRIFRVGLQQQRALKRAIEKSYQLAGFSSDPDTWTRKPPAFRMIHDILNDEESTAGATVATLLSRLDVLFDVEVFSDHPTYTLDELLREVTVVDLSRLFNNEHRLAVARFFLQKIYNQMLMMGESRDLRLFVTVDEAHRLSYDETLLKLIKEARKYGIGILLASQEPSDFPATALELPGTRIFLQQGPRGAKTIASHLEPTETKRRRVLEGELQNLDVGEAYIKSNHFIPFEKIKVKFFYERLGSA